MNGAASEIVVVGAGPAGLAAAIRAARRGRQVTLLEKAARPGVKILLSGGNRCNLTHDCDAATVARTFGRDGARFLGPALRLLGPRELRDWIESLGVPTKVEPGGKVFPVSDRAADVRDALEREMEAAGVRFVGKTAVRHVEVERAGEGPDRSSFVVHSDEGRWRAPQLILALGGRSYPKVGTTGEGYALALALGHSIKATTPALVPLVVEVAWVRDLSGVTLDDVEILLEVDEPGEDAAAQDRSGPPRRRVIDVRRGGFLFTHFGLSGPAPMNLGGAVAEVEAAASVAPAGLAQASLRVDFAPGLKRAELEEEWRAAAKTHGQRPLRAVVADRVPRRLAEALLRTSAIPPELPLAQLSKQERARLLDALFATRLPVHGTRGFDFAEVTRGGVPLAEVEPTTLRSRLVPGLYLCGELLDVDGPIGGTNFTAAFATGMLAGESAAADTPPT